MKQWFANKGQVVQCASGVLSLTLGILSYLGQHKNWLDLSLASWLAPMFWGITIGIAIGLAIHWWRQKSNANPIYFESWKFVTDDREQTTYKRKLYITVRNTSDNLIVIGPHTEWIEGELHVNTIAEHVWQVEGRRGVRNNDWETESAQVTVPPGKRVRTWVGLPIGANETDVERIIKGKQAGNLSIPIAPVRTIMIDIK